MSQHYAEISIIHSSGSYKRARGLQDFGNKVVNGMNL